MNLTSTVACKLSATSTVTVAPLISGVSRIDPLPARATSWSNFSSTAAPSTAGAAPGAGTLLARSSVGAVTSATVNR